MIVAGTGLSAVFATVPPTPPATEAPAATILRTDWVVGEKMRVQGTNWPEGKAIVQVCGNAAVNGTNDCDVVGTRSFGVGKNHSFTGQILVGAPPAPCPCVVLVGTNFHEQVVLIPITIKDQPLLSGTPTADPNAGLTTLSLSSSFVRGDWWRDAVGISPARIMTVTVTNTGERPTGNGVVDITVGKENPPTGFAASISFESLDPGESTSVAAKFAVDSFAYGTYNMAARVTTPAAGGQITEQTSTFPGYLLVLLILAILVIDLIWMTKVRRRRHMFATAEAAATAAREAHEAREATAQAQASAAAIARAEGEELAAREATEGLLALLAGDQGGTDDDELQAYDGVTSSEPTPEVPPPMANEVVSEAPTREKRADAPQADAPAPVVAPAAVVAAAPAATAVNGDGVKPEGDKNSSTIDDYFDKLLGDRPQT